MDTSEGKRALEHDNSGFLKKPRRGIVDAHVPQAIFLRAHPSQFKGSEGFMAYYDGDERHS